VGLPSVEHHGGAPIAAIRATVRKGNISDGAPVSRKIDIAAPGVLSKPVSDVWRKSLSVFEGDDHVVHLQGGAFDGNPKRAEPSFTSTDIDTISLFLEIGHLFA
jgi:hypothetical protein